MRSRIYCFAINISQQKQNFAFLFFFCCKSTAATNALITI